MQSDLEYRLKIEINKNFKGFCLDIEMMSICKQMTSMTFFCKENYLVINFDFNLVNYKGRIY